VKKQRLYGIFRSVLCFALALSFYPSVSYARPRTVTAPTVLSETDSRIMTTLLDVPEDDFNHPTIDWSLAGGSAEAVTSLDRAPYSVYEGSRSLLVTANPGSAKQVSLSRTPTVATQLSSFSAYALAIYPVTEATDLLLTLTIQTANNSDSQSVYLTAGRWQTVFFDLASMSVSGTIRSIILTVTATTEELYFLLDTVGASTNTRAAYTAQYMTTYYRPFGCATASELPLTVELNGSLSPYLEAEETLLRDFSGGIGIKVRLINRSDATSLTLTYTTLTSPSFETAPSLTVPIPSGDGVVSCLFPLSDSYVSDYRLVFDGMPEGEIEILSVTAAPCYVSTVSQGQITECLVNRNRKALSIRGMLSQEEAEAYADCPLYLYELSLFEEVSAISLRRPVAAETVLNGTTFSFSLPLSGDGTELYRKYAVMIYDAGRLLPVGTPQSVTNPEVFAINTDGWQTSSLKGAWPLDEEYVFDGLSQTVVEIRLEEIVSLGEKATIHAAGPHSVSMDLAYLTALDRNMQHYEKCGIGVTFLLRLGVPDDPSLSHLLCHPAASGGTYAAFDVQSENGIALLHALTDALVRRYATSSGVTENLVGITVGSAINEAYHSYNLGAVTLINLAKQYGNAFRVVYNAARSVASELAISIPLTGAWYGGMTAGQRSAFDASSTLQAVSAFLKAGGDVEWSLAYDICAGQGAYAWQQTPDRSTEAARISAANLEVLLDRLSESDLFYSGQMRGVILLETEPHEAMNENDRICLSADYVYTYLRLASREMKAITAYLPAHPVDYGDTLKYIDTNHFSQATAYAVELIGGRQFETLLSQATTVTRCYLNEIDAFSVIPSSVKGQTSLFDFTYGAEGWGGSLYCAELRGGVSLEGQPGFLSMRLASAPATAWRGAAVRFRSAIDLTVAPYVGFDLRSAILPDGIEELEVAVVMTSGASRQVSTMIVPAGVAATVVINLSSFPGSSSCDGMAVYIRGTNGQDIGEPTLILSSIRAMSEDRSDADLNQVLRNPMAEEEVRKTVPLMTVIAVGAVGVAALILEIWRTVIRHKKHEDDESYPIGD